MERRISLSIEPGTVFNTGIWNDVLLKDGEPVQTVSLKLELPFDIHKRNSNSILIHSRILDNPFYITLNPSNNTITYQQGRDEDILLISTIKDNLKEQLMDYFNDVLEGERALATFEFTDRETTNDPRAPNQSAGKRRKKTRRMRRH